MLLIKNLYKKYDDFYLQDINLHVNKGEYFVLLGPSGAGKTVLFETIAGLEKPNSGSITLNGKDITRQPIRRRDVGIVFQDGAVFPHMTVRKNLGYALKSKKISGLAVKQHVEKLAAEVGITSLLHRKPETLSGGELQRVAIARTLATQPKCLLLDEPLASLDFGLRQSIRDLLKGLHKKGLTILHITHDYHEAFYLAEKLAIIDNGKIVQTGTPSEIISNPGSRFVAGFIGIRNCFSYKLINPGQLLIENRMTLFTDKETGASGTLLIPNESIEIAGPYPTGNNKNTFSGKVANALRFPDKAEITVDIGFALHINIPAGNRILKDIKVGQVLYFTIDLERFIYLRNNSGADCL